MEGRVDKNRPKWHVLHRLCHLVGFFFFFQVLLLLTNILRYYWCYISTGLLREGNNNDNRPKRCKMHHLDHFVSFFFFFICVLLILTNKFGTINILKIWDNLGKVATTKSGPNDTSCDVWAIGKYLFTTLINASWTLGPNDSVNHHSGP